MYQVNWTREVFTPVGLVAILVTVLALGLLSLVVGVPEPSHHVHADIAVYINGERFDLTTPAELSVQPCVLTADGEEIAAQHFVYSSNGILIHSFHPDITYANFFASLGITFEDNLFMASDDQTYVSTEEKGFTFFIDNQEVATIADKPIEDLERVLITYGNKDRDELSYTRELSELTSEACLASVICEDIREEVNPCAGLSPLERILYLIQSWF